MPPAKESSAAAPADAQAAAPADAEQRPAAKAAPAAAPAAARQRPAAKAAPAAAPAAAAAATPAAADKTNYTESSTLKNGWKKLMRWRSSGASKGNSDTYYISPDGRKCRSRKDVEKHIASNGVLSPW